MAESVVFNVDQFKAAMIGGGARANQFFVTLNFPSYVAQGGAAAAQAAFLVNAATLPGSIVQNTAIQYRGRQVNFAGERVFNPWTITVMNDNSFKIRNSLEAWMNGMNNLVDNTGLTNPVNYQANLAVTQLDRNNAPLKSYTIHSAYPIDVSDITLNFGDNDTIETYTVTFQYQHYTVDNAGSVGNLVANAASSVFGI